MGRAFLPGDATASGLSEARLRSRDIDRPFHGVRGIALNLNTTLDRCTAYEPRLRPGQFFSHATAALLHRIPLPLHLELDPVLHIAARAPASRPRTVGVVGHVAGPDAAVGLMFGLPVADAVETWCQLASVLTVDELIAAGDYLVSGRATDHGRDAPLATLEQLQAAVGARAGRRGARALGEASDSVRCGVDSPQESKLRMLLVRSGLPEPVINEPTFDVFGVKLGRPDLKYPAARVVLEYEGDEHRTSRRRFRSDIFRRERFEDADWRVKRVTADDLNVRPVEFVASVHALLLARGMQLPPLELPQQHNRPLR